MTLPPIDPGGLDPAKRVPIVQAGSIPATQTRHPWRATIRTIVAALLAFAPALPAIVEELGLAGVGWVATLLAVTGAVTRVLAIPSVDQWLQRHAPWLSAEGRQT